MENEQTPEHRQEERERSEEAYLRHELEHPHSWGDLRTWFWILLLTIGGIVHTIIIEHAVGDQVLGPQQWNLGYPPTAPSLILPFLLSLPW